MGSTCSTVEIRIAYKIVITNPQGKISVEDRNTWDGTKTHFGTKMNVQVIGIFDNICLQFKFLFVSDWSVNCYINLNTTFEVHKVYENKIVKLCSVYLIGAFSGRYYKWHTRTKLNRRLPLFTLK
jgi:hypothetical protein